MAVLLAAHSGAAKETDRVRPLCRTLRATARPVLLCALSFRPPPRCAVWEATAAHRRVQPGIGGGGSGAAVGTPGRGHGEGQIGASTETLRAAPYPLHACAFSLTCCRTALRRMGCCRCTGPHPGRRRRRWCWRCWRHTRERPRKRTRCARCARATLRAAPRESVHFLTRLPLPYAEWIATVAARSAEWRVNRGGGGAASRPPAGGGRG